MRAPPAETSHDRRARAAWVSPCRRARDCWSPGDSRAGLSCVDDSPECVEQRQATLKAMLADKDRAWVKEPATPQAHASGVRLFAFRSKKRNSPARSWRTAAKRRKARPRRSRASQGLSPAQISRAVMFAAEVNKELAVEMKKRRCRA